MTPPAQVFNPDVVELIEKNQDTILGRKTFSGQKTDYKEQIDALNEATERALKKRETEVC